MNYFIHRYFLKRKLRANRVTDSEGQVGALLKILDDEGSWGVADLCPWPSLGDADLRQELSVRGPLFHRALELARKDLAARKSRVKLSAGTAVKNHYLISDFQHQDVSAFYGNIVKVKGDAAVITLANFLEKHVENFTAFRLDFNGTLSKELYFDFESRLSPRVIAKIECVEDPFPFEASAWKEARLKLCADFLPAHGWPWRVIKPSREAATGSFNYLTSALDHPVGLAHALAEAEAHPHLTHGFLTLNHYEPTAFHKYFVQDKNSLSCLPQGFGIGFDQELNGLIWEPLIDFSEAGENQLLFDPDSSSSERSDFVRMRESFNEDVRSGGYFLIPSSGSSNGPGESLKLYALSKVAVLNSARRVNHQFHLSTELNWGCLLPTFHVSGLGIIARARVAESQVFFERWPNFSVDWIEENEIQVLSLVPTQIFDLVAKNVTCPQRVKFVFVGGAQLEESLMNQARALGWPLVLTFGMTETASMIAYKNPAEDSYAAFNGVQLGQSQTGKLRIKCNSLASYLVQVINDEIFINEISKDGWYETQDFVSLQHNRFVFLNKENDQVKIKGEGVSLFSLRQRLERILVAQGESNTSMALVNAPDARDGQKLVLAAYGVSDVTLAKVKDLFNQQAGKVERIKEIVLLKEKIPVSAVQKIRYNRLKELVYGTMET